MMNILIKSIAFLILFIFIHTLTNGQTKCEIPRLSKEIIFDGKPDETAWKNVMPFPLIKQQPVYGGEPSQKTDIRLTFDDKYVYLGASFYVDNPEMIKAIGKVRDFDSRSCDWVGLQLDTYNDNQNGFMFFTNPNGIRWDATIKTPC